MDAFLVGMPKVELHVHLEGAIPPETLIELAPRAGVDLPGSTVEEIERWYAFRDFPHFAEVYRTLSSCVRTPSDIEEIARDFLVRQARQNVIHTEVTWTALTHVRNGIPWPDQIAALDSARRWAADRLGVSCGFIIDIPREAADAEEALEAARWAIEGLDKGVVALGLGGYEVGYPPERFAAAFAVARDAGLPAVVHAGETAGPGSIWGALDHLHAVRIGHGVRCLEDPDLVARLREERIPLEVCPSSNVCLGVATELSRHPLPELLDAGLNVTLGSDDPPMFSTSINDEYVRVARTFGLSRRSLAGFALAGASAALVDGERRQALEAAIFDYCDGAAAGSAPGGSSEPDVTA